MDHLKTELEIACKLIRLLDGLSIEQADHALIHAKDTPTDQSNRKCVEPASFEYRGKRTALNPTVSRTP
jgi:hypothetical protein